MNESFCLHTRSVVGQGERGLMNDLAVKNRIMFSTNREWSPIKRLPIAILLLIGMSTAMADKIYKSVDADGNVTYSSQPPDDSVNVERIRVAPSPGEEELRAAQERERRISESANTLADQREQREEARRKADREAAERQAAEAQRQPTYEERRRDRYYYGYPGLWYPIPPLHPGQPGRPPHRPHHPIAPGKPVVSPHPGGGSLGPGGGFGR